MVSARPRGHQRSGPPPFCPSPHAPVLLGPTLTSGAVPGSNAPPAVSVHARRGALGPGPPPRGGTAADVRTCPCHPARHLHSAGPGLNSRGPRAHSRGLHLTRSREGRADPDQGRASGERPGPTRPPSAAHGSGADPTGARARHRVSLQDSVCTRTGPPATLCTRQPLPTPRGQA